MAVLEPLDRSRSGCPETTDGQHMIDWTEIPAQYYNGPGGAQLTYDAHARGECIACLERFAIL